MPASNVSSRWKSWNAFRFSAMFDCAFSRTDFADLSDISRFSVLGSKVLGSFGSRFAVLVLVRFSVPERPRGEPAENQEPKEPRTREPRTARFLRRSSEASREEHRGDHALRIGDALACDVERRPVIDRRADDRQ